MKILRALALAVLLTAPASAAVHLSIRPGPLPPEDVARTEAASAQLLEAPARAEAEGGLCFSAPSWKRGLAPAERQRLTRALEALWGDRMVVREDADTGPMPGKQPPASAFDYRSRTDEMRTRLEAAPRPMDRSSQGRIYDGGVASKGAPPASAGARPTPSARPLALGAAAPQRKASSPPPPVPAAASEISWKRAGVEVVKGAANTIKEMFTWKGLAVAAASIALVTVAPVAIYGLLVLGAAFSGYMIGKALLQGTAAYKARDAEKFYGASQEMGRGLLGLGLTMIGARHAPTNLRPHFPRTGGEWKAMAAAVDDEPIIAMSILREHGKKG